MYKRFEDLKAWQLARTFRQEIYKISKTFPKEEIYALTTQIRQAGYSITSNIAKRTWSLSLSGKYSILQGFKRVIE